MEMQDVPHLNRVVLCMDVYESYQGINLGQLVSPKPCKMLVPLVMIEVTFRHAKVPPKQIELLSCGFEAMVFTNYHEPIKNVFLFKGILPETVFILKKGTKQNVTFVDMVRGVDWEAY